MVYFLCIVFSKFVFTEAFLPNQLVIKNDLTIHSVISNLDPSCLIKIIYFSIDSAYLQSSYFIPLQIKHLTIEYSDIINNASILTRYLYSKPLTTTNCLFNLFYFKELFNKPPLKPVDYEKLAMANLISLNFVTANLLKSRYMFKIYSIPSYNVMVTENKLHSKDNIKYKHLFGNEFIRIPNTLEPIKLYDDLNRYAILDINKNTSTALFCSLPKLETAFECNFTEHTLLSFANSSRIKDLMNYVYFSKFVHWHWVMIGDNLNVQWSPLQTTNPFLASSPTQCLAEELITKHSNGSLISQEELYDKVGTINIGNIYMSTSAYNYEDTEATTLAYDEYKFLTCYKIPTSPFYLYVSPLDSLSWIFIFIVFLSSCVLLQYIVSKTDNHAVSTSVSLFAFGIILGVSVETVSSFWRNRIWRSVLIPLFIFAVVVVNCYKSLLISNLNGLDKGQKIRTLQEVLCPLPDEFNNIDRMEIVKAIDVFWFKCTSDSSDELSSYYAAEHLGKQTQFADPKCFSILLAPYETSANGNLGSIWLDFFDLSNEITSVLKAPSKTVSNEIYNGIIKLLSPLSRHYPLLDDFDSELFRYWNSSSSAYNFTRENWVGNHAIELEFIKCKKQVLLGTESNLKEEMNYLQQNYKSKDFYMTQGTILKSKLGWSVKPEKLTDLPRKIKRVNEAGLLRFLQGNLRYRKTLKRRFGTNIIKSLLKIDPEMTTKIKITGPAQSIFVLWLILASFSFGTFLFETRNCVLKMVTGK